jgi:3-hydroxyanthranilate 3,4-dioxygenase
VGNKYLYDGNDFFVMVIGGPNARNDFHVTNSEEYFFQVKGDIVVRILEGGVIKDVPIREGERRRPPGETEHQQFYCDNCSALVYDKEFDCKDIVEHFAQSMEEFWADPDLSTCKKCGTRVEKPTPVKRIVFEPQIVIERE